MTAAVRKNGAAWLVLILLPVLAHGLDLAGVLSADPINFTSGLITSYPDVLLRGLPGWHDPNIGFTTQALGGLAARQWLSGALPWWNAYSGVGMPLAAEMQNSAFFLPFVLLMAAPDGPVLVKICLQIIAGLATFALLRQLGLRRRIALVGGILYGLNGTFALVGDAPIMPVPFLPLLLLGLERARERAALGRRGGGGWITVAIAYAIYAGFPETAFLNGLLALAWAGYRFATEPGGARWRFAAKVAAGGVLGLLIAAPLILAFFEYLAVAYAGLHDSVGTMTLYPGNFAMILFPYVLGPIDFGDMWVIWGNAGGYFAVPLLLLAVLALWRGGRAFGLRVLLAAWIAAALAKSVAVPGITALFNALPFVGQTAFYRYAPPSWEFAGIMLVAFCLDDWQHGRGAGSRRLAVTTGLCAAASVIALVLVKPVMVVITFVEAAAIFYFAAGLAWTLAIAVAVVVVIARPATPRRAATLCAVLALDAWVTFSLPLLSGAPRSTLDLGGVELLQREAGLARFFTLGPFSANYGAYFGVASINHNYLPVPYRWVDYVRAHLDPAADDVNFTGGFPPDTPGQETRAAALAHRLDAYRAVGVKYVLARPNVDPFAGMDPHPPRIYRSGAMDIYQLPDPAPYFAAPCRLEFAGRQAVHADCPAAATLTRRELFFPGWVATVNGAPAAIVATEEIFQAVALPAGRSDIRFAYAPPHIGWAYAAFWLGLAGLLAGLALARRPVVSRGALGSMT